MRDRERERRDSEREYERETGREGLRDCMLFIFILVANPNRPFRAD